MKNMKKFTLFLVATLFSVLSFAALNPYAYGLESSLEGTKLTVNYSLNAPATAVSVVIMDGAEEVKTVTCNGITKGSHTVEISTLDLPTGKSLTWKVDVKGAAVAEPTQQSTNYSFYHPSAVDIDNNPENETFGLLLVNDAMQKVKNATTHADGSKYVASGFGAGIFVFNPAFEPMPNGDEPGYNGGITFTTTRADGSGTAYAPRRIRISDDGRIFVTSLNTDGVYLWEVNPENMNEWTPIFKGTLNTEKELVDNAGNFIAAPNNGFDVKGKGEKLKLAMYSVNLKGIKEATMSCFRLHEYNLGNATEWTTAPSKALVEGKYAINYTGTQVEYDNEGGFWIASHRGGTASDDNPGLVHINADGVEDAKLKWNYLQQAGIRFNKDFTKLVVAGINGGSKSVTKKATVYTISKDANGAPVLTEEVVVDMATVGANLNDFAWDYAGNLYACGNSSEKLVAWAMPRKAEEVVSTPCASKYAFEVGEVVANVYTLTTNVVGEGTVEGNAGSYVEGKPATLTATPAAHYDFLNWTYGSETSTDNPLTITVNSDLTVTANFQEHAKYTIDAHADDNSKGYVTGGAVDIYVGTNISLKATAKTGYYFTQWNDGNTDNPRAITVTGDAEYIAEFGKAYPRVYAYDLDVADNGDTYTFSFKPNTNAASGNLLLYNEDGTAVVQTHAISTDIVAHTATSITLNKTELPNQADVPWAIQLSGNPIPAFAETFADADYRFAKGHAAVDNSPESEYFGRVYVADRRSTKSKSGFYVYNIDFTPLNTEANDLGMSSAGYSRPAVGADGTVYLTGYTDDESGIFVVDPADLTKCTQFYDGTRAGSGLFTNGGVEIGSSTSGVGAYGVGKDAVLYSMMEDGTDANANSGKQPIVMYQIGQEDGTVLKQWSTAPTWHINYPATGKDTYNFGNNAFAATEEGVWISQNKSNDDDRPEIAFIDKTGAIQFMQNLNKSQGAGLAVNADNTILYLQKAGEILEYTIAWTGNTPALTLANTYPVSLPYITTLSLDYAGNLIACAGTQYGSNTNNNVMKLVAYTLPTNDNTCIVPAAKAKALKLGVRYNVEVLVNDNTMGRATGGGDYKEGETATLIATPAANHCFVNWTKGEEVVSTETTYSFVVTEDVTLTANFEAIPQYAITVETSNADQGSVTGGGTYYEGTEVTIRATAVGGFVFEKWSDDNTANPRTITVNGAAAYTAIFKVAPARVFAYNLDVVENGDDTYTLSFIPNANAISGRVILYNDDTKAQIHEATIAGTIAKGVKSEVVVSKSVMPTSGTVTWAVELTGEQVEKLTLLTKADDKANYGFNRPQGVAIDNNPASDFFGRIYIALPKAGGTEYSDTNYGIVVMDPQHKRLKSGIVSHGDALGSNGRYSMHRVTVNPTNGHVYYVRTSDSGEGVTGTAIYELAPDATNILTDGGTAKNVINGISEITNANSVCFDETGAMYVVANANYVDGASMGRVYKVVDGIATLVTQTSREIASKDNAIVPDGKGGFWIAQHRNNLDGFNHLLHINASGAADYTISKDENASLLPVQTYVSKEDGKTYNNASYRGQVAYYSIDENNGLLAYGGGAKVSVFKATYEGSGVPTLSTWQTISLLSQSETVGINVDGLAFDYAGNLIVMSATDERMYQYALPIETANTSLVPSPTSKAIKLGTIYNVEVTVNDPAMGTATGGGEYVEGETATLTATPNTGYRFVNWTYGSETSTNNPLELVVEGNITVTANFEPIQYTLIASTNDEDKGTVTGAGTYNYGTEVTLTANPAAGYKLLYWSDRSTENPRTITMTKNEAISAYFVKEYTEEPTFTITKMWENTNVPTSTNNGYQAVGWDGKIYMKDRLGAAINVYTESGSELYVNTDAFTTDDSNKGDQPIAIDDAGNIIIRSGSGLFYNAPTQVTIYKKDEKVGTVIDFTLPTTGRCDFISASGNIFSAEGGYVYFYCQNQTTISRLYIKNGGVTVDDIAIDELDATLTKGSTQSHVFKNIFGDLMTHTRADVKVLQEVNVVTGTVNTMNLPNFKVSTLGACSFELGGKELIAYNIKGKDYNSEWNLYNMTDGKFLSDETLYAKDKTSAKDKGAANWLNVQVVDENTAYIYLFCPTVAVAVWKVTCTTDINVTIDEKADNTTALTPYEGKEVIANVTRNFGANKILTLTLPFDMDAVQISQHFGNATVYEFYNVVDAGEELHLQFSRTTSLEAGKPYLIQTTSGYDAEDGFTIENVVISTELNPVKLSGITMVPVLDAGGTLDQPTQYYLYNNALYCAGEHDQPLLGLRAFFTSDSPTQIRARVIFDENEETSIPVVTAPENNTQKVIKDGRLIIIRGEQQYNAQGQIIE